MSTARISSGLVCGIAVIVVASQAAIAASPTAMVPMAHVGPQSQGVDLKAFTHVIRVSPNEMHRTVTSALASIRDASSNNRYAILVAAGTYNESRIPMKPFVDLYGGFSASDWKERDVYRHATILD